jgi:hypothetical protein
MFILKKIIQTKKELGTIHFIFFCLHRFISLATKGKARIERYIMASQPIAKKPRLPPNRGKNIHVVELSQGDELLSEVPRPLEVINERFKQGSHCLAATKDGHLVAFLWLIFDGYDEDMARVRYLLPNNEYVWDYDVYVYPEHRFGLAFAKLWDGTDEWLRSRNVTYSFSRISAFNPSSRFSHGSLGAKEIGITNIIIIGNWELMWSNFAPRFFNFSKYRRPTINLPALTTNKYI